MEDIITVEKIAVFANGVIEDYDALLPDVKGYGQYIAVDGGLCHCAPLGVTPLFLVGDEDSVNPDDVKKFPGIKRITSKQDKDETDLELALSFLMKKNPQSITIFGGWGGRIDQALTNLILLSRYPGKVFLETEKEIIGAIDQSIELGTFPGQIVSLIPLNGPAMGITTDGLKWELKEGDLDKSFVGVSNEATQSAICVSVKSGDLLFSLSKGNVS